MHERLVGFGSYRPSDTSTDERGTMKIELEPDRIVPGHQVARWRRVYTVMHVVGNGREFTLKDTKTGKTHQVIAEALVTHYKRTGNTSYTPRKK